MDSLTITFTIEDAFSCHMAGHYDQARRIYQQILQHNPDDYNALQLLGVLELAAGDCSLATKLIGKAVTLVDSDPSAYNNLGEAYRGLNQLQNAERCYRRAVSLDSGYAIAYNNLALTLYLLHRLEDAETVCHQALVLSPDFSDAYNNLGIILAAGKRYSEAETAYLQALRIKHNHTSAYVNLGILYKNTGRHSKSKQAYRNALQISPDDKDALYNLSLLELLQGRLRSGFMNYENRSEAQAIYANALPQCLPWHGGDLLGKSLLVIAEQGAGDSIMMSRYLPLLKKTWHAQRIGYFGDESLRRIFSLLQVIDIFVPDTEQPPFDLFDYYCPMMSLPHAFNTTLRSIPHVNPYLTVPDEIIGKWRNIINRLPGVKVGLAWAGNKKLAADEKRSIPLAMFEPLFEVAGISFVSLQKGDSVEQLYQLDQNILDVMEECDDYLDTAALMMSLDLVISVDTSVAHLAGALGKRIWLLNRYESEWRWLLKREDSPWYPTLRIFRQESISDWQGVIKRVAEELRIGFTC